MTARYNVSRRTVLATGGLTAAGAVLAGCSAASSSKTAADAATTPAAGSSTPDAVSSPASSADSSTAGTPTAGTSSATSAAPSGTAVAKLSDIPVGGSISATLSGKPIVLSQPTAGAVVGFSAICTHQGCTVTPSGKAFDCPCHGSQFDAATGAVLRGPAPTALPKLTIAVSGGSVLASTQG